MIKFFLEIRIHANNFCIANQWLHFKPFIRSTMWSPSFTLDLQAILASNPIRTTVRQWKMWIKNVMKFLRKVDRQGQNVMNKSLHHLRFNASIVIGQTL